MAVGIIVKGIVTEVAEVIDIAVVAELVIELGILEKKFDSLAAIAAFAKVVNLLVAQKVMASALTTIEHCQVAMAILSNTWRKHFQPYFCFPLAPYLECCLQWLDLSSNIHSLYICKAE